MSELSETVYRELHAIARKRMVARRPGETLQPTALVSEVWLKMRGHFDADAPTPAFFKVAAEAMRQILIDHARGKKRLKRGGGEAKRHEGDVAEIAEAAAVTDATDFDQILSLNDALSRMERLDPQAAEVVKLRFFGGLGVAEPAAALGVSERTVKRDWQFARAWLAKELSPQA